MIYKKSIKTLFSITLFSVLIVLATIVSASAQQIGSGGLSLDRRLVNWNRAASGLPQLPRSVAGSINPHSRCIVRAQIYERRRLRFNATRDYLVITNVNPNNVAMIVKLVR